MLTLVLGGARSGKSRYAESLIGTGPAFYVATAQSYDDEMDERIRHHREDRPASWRTLEEPLDLPGALIQAARDLGPVGREPHPILVDCLTLWLTNLLLAERDISVETQRLLDVLSGLACPIVLVSNEVGQGIVPDNALARAFRDHAGRLHQTLAAQADRVVFVVAGLPLALKGSLP